MSAAEVWVPIVFGGLATVGGVLAAAVTIGKQLGTYGSKTTQMDEGIIKNSTEILNVTKKVEECKKEILEKIESYNIIIQEQLTEQGKQVAMIEGYLSNFNGISKGKGKRK